MSGKGERGSQIASEGRAVAGVVAADHCGSVAEMWCRRDHSVSVQ